MKQKPKMRINCYHPIINPDFRQHPNMFASNLPFGNLSANCLLNRITKHGFMWTFFRSFQKRRLQIVSKCPFFIGLILCLFAKLSFGYVPLKFKI